MLTIRNILVIIILGVLSFKSSAQLITNSGREFWFAFPEMYDKTAALYWLNITSNTAASGTVSIPGASWTQTFTVTPGAITRVDIPSNLATIIGSNIYSNRAIRVSSNNDVVVFAVTYHRFRHEASLVIPNRALGQRYRVTTYPSEIKGSQLYESEFSVVAGRDTVIARITPKGNIAFGNNVNVAYTVTIPPNTVYQAQARSSLDDLTGTLITSVNNKDFSVYAGNVWSTIVCTPNSDPLLEGMFPTNTWGKDYFVLPTPNINKEHVRIVADQNGTRVFRDGVLRATLNAGQIYSETITTIRNYTANKPISLAHFLVTGQAICSNYANTDPSMIMCNPTEQMFLDSITFFAVDTADIDSHYVHVITGTADTGRMYLDSLKMTGFRPFTQNGRYSYRTVSVKEGYHRLETTGCGFLAYSVGIGRAVSYGYATGVSLVDLSNSITYKNALTGSDTICSGDSVQFKSIIRGNPIKFSWDFGDGGIDSIPDPVHIFNKVGNFQIRAIIEYPCLVDTVFDTLYVPPPPIIDLGPDTILCNLDTLRFKANTRFFKTLWSNNSTDSNLAISQPGTYMVTVTNYCGSDMDTVKIDSLYPDTVDLGRDFMLCKGDTVRFDVTAVWGSTYLWQDTSRYPFYTILKPGLYWAQVSNVCGVMRDTLIVKGEEAPKINLGNDTLLCDGQSIFLNAYFSRSTYKWNNGSRQAFQRTAAPGGEYIVEIDNPCGKGYDTIEVLYDYPLNLNLGPDSIICLGDTIWKDPITRRGIYLWQDGVSDSVNKITGKGTYWIVVQNACGIYSDTVSFVEERTPVVNLPPDTLICRGESIFLDATFSRSSYKWNTGQSTPTMTVSAPGNFMVTTTNLCGSAIDDIQVLYDRPLNVDAMLGPDTFFCDFASFNVVLNIPNNPHYEWNTGQTSPILRVSHEGTYIVTVTNRCGAYSGKLLVNAMYTPEPELGSKQIACEGQVVGLNANIPREKRRGVMYEWDNGHTDWKRGVAEPGNYWVRTYNQCGEARDTVQVRFNPIPNYPMNDTLLCLGDEIVFDYSDSVQHTFLWNNEIESNYYVIDTSGSYVVKIFDNAGCTAFERFKVKLCPTPFYAPNAFTPNGDDINSRFRVFKTGIYDFEIIIVNRWNQEVYRSNEINEGWDGSKFNQGNKCPPGKYVFTAKFKEAENHQVQQEIGEVYLMK